MSDDRFRDSFGPVPRAPGVKGWIIALALLGTLGLGAGVTLAMRYVQARATERRQKRARIVERLDESLRRSTELRERIDEMREAEMLASWIALRLREAHSPDRWELARAARDVGSQVSEWTDVRCEGASFSWRSWKFVWHSGDETAGDAFGLLVGRRGGSREDDVLVVPASRHFPSLYTSAAPAETLAELIASLPAPDPSGELFADGRWLDADGEILRLMRANLGAIQEALEDVQRARGPDGAPGTGQERGNSEPSAEEPEADSPYDR